MGRTLCDSRKVNYRIVAENNPNRLRVAHVNDLKLYNVDPNICTLQVIAEDIESVPSLTLADVELTIQRTIQEVLSHYTDVVTNVPGTTNVVQARIDTEEGGLVCLPPYRIPETKREQVKQELDKLVAQGILEKHESHGLPLWL